MAYSISLIILFISRYIFTIFMKRKYKVTSLEFQKIKSKNINRPIYFLIILAIVLFIVITLENNIYTMLILGVILIVDFIYGLRRIKRLNEYKYTLYYIGDEAVSFLFFILMLTVIFR